MDFISKNSSKLDANNLVKDKEVKDQLSDVLEELERRINSDGLTGVPTGFRSLDKFTGGWQETDLVILGGASSMGKTSLALAFALNAAKQKIPTAIFSYEMSYQQLLMRMISSETGIDNKWMLNGTLDMDNLKLIHKEINKIEKYPLYIDDCNRTSLTYLLNKIRKLHSTKGIKLVLVDYLQLVNASTKKNNREQEVSLIARSLKNISKELGITIIALSQLNRGVGLRTESRPTMADLRESGEIEQAADIVALVYRPEYYGITDVEGKNTRGLAEIIFAKGRNIGVGKINMEFIPNLTKFVDK
jgi:replicative DNA helicase